MSKKKQHVVYSKVYFQTLIDELEPVLHYLEDRLKLVQEIYEGAVRLGDRPDLLDGTTAEAARLVQLVANVKNRIAMAEQDMKKAP